MEKEDNIEEVVVRSNRICDNLDVRQMNPSFKTISPYMSLPLKNSVSYGEWCSEKIKQGKIDDSEGKFMYKDRLEKLLVLTCPELSVKYPDRVLRPEG